MNACASPFRLILAAVVAIGLTAGNAFALEIEIAYADPSGYGFNDNTPYNGGPQTYGEVRREAFEYAIEYWESRLDGTIPIRLRAEFANLGGDATGAVLAGASGRFWVRLTGDNKFLPIHLVNQIVESDLTPAGEWEIRIRFNADVDGDVALGSMTWNYELDSDPAGVPSFVRTTLHELTHGLGFADMINENTGQWLIQDQNDGQFYPSVYDTLLRLGDSPGTPLTSLSNSQRRDSVTSQNLFIGGTNLEAAFGGDRAPVYAPESYAPGSSVSHYDQGAFSPPELMEPAQTDAEIRLGLADKTLADFGWELLGPDVLPALTFDSAGPVSVDEGHSFDLVLELDGSATDQTVTFQIRQLGDAEEGVHYTLGTASPSITPPDTSTTVTVNTIAGSLDDSPVSFEFQLIRVVNAEFGSTRTVSGTIEPSAEEYDIPPAARAIGDLNNDGCVDFQDFAFLLENWGTEFDGNPIAFADFVALLENWGTGC